MARKMSESENGQTLVFCHSVLLHQRTRGWVELRSSDPMETPKITYKFASHPEELRDLIYGKNIKAFFLYVLQLMVCSLKVKL